MTSPPDVQNVPDVWGLLQKAHEELTVFKSEGSVSFRKHPFLLGKIADALAQRDRFVLVPKTPVDHSVKLMPVWPTDEMLQAAHDGPLGAAGEAMTPQVKGYLIEMYAAFLDSAPEVPQVPFLLAAAPRPKEKP